MYAGVPTSAPVLVSVSSGATLALDSFRAAAVSAGLASARRLGLASRDG